MSSGKLVSTTATFVLSFLLTTAAAAQWVGENGVIRLSFTEEPHLQSVLNAEPGEGGMTIVDLYAYVDEFEPVTYEKEEFLGVGAFELKLAVDLDQAVC